MVFMMVFNEADYRNFVKEYRCIIDNQTIELSEIESLFERLLDYIEDEKIQILYWKLINYVETLDSGLGTFYRRLVRIYFEGI